MKLNEIKVKPHRAEIQAEEAWALLNKHCMQSLSNLKTPIVRGMHKIPSGFGIIHGEAGKRRSKNTSNQYTNILDAVLPPEYPRRSASIICANWKNREHASEYGPLYAIIPFDDVAIGVCPTNDMWDIEIGGVFDETIVYLNYRLEKIGVKSSWSFDKIVDHLEKLIKDGKPIFPSRGRRLDLEPGEVRDAFRHEYSKPFKLAKPNTINDFNDRPRELWIGGKCVAIDMQIYQDMMLQKRK